AAACQRIFRPRCAAAAAATPGARSRQPMNLKDMLGRVQPNPDNRHVDGSSWLRYTHSQPGTFDAVGAVHPNIFPSAWRFPKEHGHRKRSNSEVLAERWVPACAGMAREFSVEINALLLDTSWITASKAGTPEPASGSGP